MKGPEDIYQHIKHRIEEIATLIFEVANGNFDYKIPMSDNEDELDAIITGVNMLGEELKNSTVSRDYMQSIYDGVVDILIVLNADFTIRELNGSAVSQLGVRNHEIKGRPLSEIIFQIESGEHLKQIQDELGHHGQYKNTEIIYKSQSGHTIPTSSSFSLLRDNRNRVDGIMIIARDITEIKEAQQKLIKAKEDAEEANRAKGRFLSSVSHEIRTPLNGIIGFTELLQSTKTDSVQTEYLAMIKTSGDNLTKLLNDVLDLNKIDLDKLTLEKVPFNFRETVTSNLSPYKHLAHEKGLSFSFSFDDQIPIDLLGDPSRINQILVNLVGNSLKFTGSGEIDVSFKATDIQNENLNLVCEVTDTGIGVSAERQEAIFETFTQSDNSITRKYGGSGLGLAICKQLIQLMNGEIGLVSPVEGQIGGTKFWFRVPMEIISIPEQINQEEVIEEFQLPPKTRILIVDDNKVNLLLLKKNLENFGADVTTAIDGQMALDRASEKEFDMILMDLQMPVMDGYTATSILRERKFSKPIIAVSANIDKDSIKKCKEVGMDDYLQKPFHKTQLLKVIKTWV